MNTILPFESLINYIGLQLVYACLATSILKFLQRCYNKYLLLRIQDAILV